MTHTLPFGFGIAGDRHRAALRLKFERADEDVFGRRHARVDFSLEFERARAARGGGGEEEQEEQAAGGHVRCRGERAAGDGTVATRNSGAFCYYQYSAVELLPSWPLPPRRCRRRQQRQRRGGEGGRPKAKGCI